MQYVLDVILQIFFTIFLTVTLFFIFLSFSVSEVLFINSNVQIRILSGSCGLKFNLNYTMWVCSLVLFIILWDGMCLGSLSNRQVNGYHFVPNAEFPPGLQNQTSSEKNMLHFHKCRDGGEAYSAAYLIDKRHLISHNTDYNLTWVNCEMASFIMMSSARDLNKEKHGQVIQVRAYVDIFMLI